MIMLAFYTLTVPADKLIAVRLKSDFYEHVESLSV